jgi:ABC-type Na+ efflux pump permease subunit
MSAAARIRVLARPEIAEGLRNRRLLVIRALTPLAFLVVVAAITASSGPARVAEDDYVVAVEGDLDGARATLDAIADGTGAAGDDPPGVRFESSDDAALAVVRGADAGMVVPAHLDERLRTGPPAEVVLYTDADDRPSRAAAVRLRAGLFDQLVVVENPVLAVSETGFADDGEEPIDELRVAVAGAVAAFLLLQGGVLVGTAAARLTGRRATGSLVPLLLLPVSRRELVAGRAAAETGLGLITAVPMTLLLVLVAAAVALADGDPTAAVLTVLVAPVAVAAIGLPFVLVGTALGIRARSAQQISGFTAVALVVVALAARGVAGAADATSVWPAVVPVLGPAYAFARTAAGDLAVAEWVLALAGTALLAAALTSLAVRLLGAEHLALRDG